MSKLRIIYILSLALLAVLLLVTVFRPVENIAEYRQVQGGYILEREDEWVIELHLCSYEAQDTSYTIDVLVDGELITDTITIQPDRVFKYIVHIDKEGLDVGEIPLTVYKEGEDTPFEQATYYLK